MDPPEKDAGIEREAKRTATRTFSPKAPGMRSEAPNQGDFRWRGATWKWTLWPGPAVGSSRNSSNQEDAAVQSRSDTGNNESANCRESQGNS